MEMLLMEMLLATLLVMVFSMLIWNKKEERE